VSFIQAHQARWGVEPICRVLQIAPSSYYAAVRRPPSARQQRDEVLKVAIRRVWDAHRQVYGADKVWAQLNRDGTRVARCTVERLMRESGLWGVVRGRRSVRTTRSDEASDRPADLVARQFQAPRPNRLWVAEVVRTQLTKPHGLAAGAGGNDVADLHLAVPHDHPVNQQLHQLTPLLERRRGQSCFDSPTDGRHRPDHPVDLRLAVDLGRHLLLLVREQLLLLLEFPPTPVVLGQGDDAAQIRLRQPLHLLAELPQSPS
jgi:hypothetical protein